jgi:hypothetical protein
MNRMGDRSLYPVYPGYPDQKRSLNQEDRGAFILLILAILIQTGVSEIIHPAAPILLNNSRLSVASL